LVVVNFEPPAIPKLISPINDYELAQAHAEALCSKKGSGTIEEMAKAKEILTEACLYIEPEILAFFEYYGVSVDVKESKYPNLKAFYSHMEKTLNITPAFLNSYSGDRTSDSVHPEQVGSLIHEFGHTFDQLLTRHPDSPFLNIKRQTPEQKEYIPIFKRMYRHSKIEETSDGGLLIGGFPYEKAQLDKTRAGSSLPFFPSVLDMLDDFFSEYADEYADEGSEEKFAEFFRARTGVPLYESKLPKEIPADAKTNFPGDDGCIEFARLHPLQLLNDRKLVRAFADRFASEPMEQMDKICAAVIDHVLNTPELLDRSQNPGNYKQRSRPLDVSIFGPERAYRIGNTLDRWSRTGESFLHRRANRESQSGASFSVDSANPASESTAPPTDLWTIPRESGKREESANPSAKGKEPVGPRADPPLQQAKGQPVPRLGTSVDVSGLATRKRSTSRSSSDIAPPSQHGR